MASRAMGFCPGLVPGMKFSPMEQISELIKVVYYMITAMPLLQKWAEIAWQLGVAGCKPQLRTPLSFSTRSLHSPSRHFVKTSQEGGSSPISGRLISLCPIVKVCGDVIHSVLKGVGWSIFDHCIHVKFSQ